MCCAVMVQSRCSQSGTLKIHEDGAALIHVMGTRCVLNALQIMLVILHIESLSMSFIQGATYLEQSSTLSIIYNHGCGVHFR